MDNFAKLFENEKIIGVKYTNADFYLLERLRERFPDKLILSGFDEMLLPALALDVDGAIGSTFNINAKRQKLRSQLLKQVILLKPANYNMKVTT